MLTAAALVGLGIGALEIGCAYVSEREQFGVPIGSFQAMQHTLADVSVALDGAQLLARKAAWAHDTGHADAAQLAAFAFLFAAEQAQRATERVLHFHGGYGFMQEYDIQLFYRRAKGWPIVLGPPSNEYARLADLRYGRVPSRWRADVDFAPSDAVERFRAEVRELIAEHFTAERPRRGERHRHHPRLGAPPRHGRTGLDPPGAARGAGRRRARPRGARRASSPSSSSRARRTTA